MITITYKLFDPYSTPYFSAIAMSNPIKINKDNLGTAKSQLIFPQQVTMRMVNPVNGGSVPTTLVLAPIQKSNNAGNLGGSITTQILPKTEVSPSMVPKSQVIEEIETHSPPVPSSLSSGETTLYDLREKAVAIKSCMSLTMDEVEKLILGDMVVKGMSQYINHINSMIYHIPNYILLHIFSVIEI